MSVTHNKYAGYTLKHLLLRHMYNLPLPNYMLPYWLISLESVPEWAPNRECTPYCTVWWLKWWTCVDVTGMVFWDRSPGGPRWCLLGGACLWFQGGGVCSRGSASEGVWSWRGVSQHAMTPPPCEHNSWHTLLKILPCPNFVAGGNNYKMATYLIQYILRHLV